MNIPSIFMAALLIVSGCTWFGQRDAWSTLDSRLQGMLDPRNENSKELFIARFGEPLQSLTLTTMDRFGSPTGQEERLLWLWEADGSGPSTQLEQGWEILLRFNKKNGKYAGWERGAYRTALTLADVMTAVRKVGYADWNALMKELGFGASPDSASPAGSQKKIITVAKAVSLLDDAAKTVQQVEPNQSDLATESDVIKYLHASKLYRVDVLAKKSPTGKLPSQFQKYSILLSALSPFPPGHQEPGNQKGLSELPLSVPAPNF